MQFQTHTQRKCHVEQMDDEIHLGLPRLLCFVSFSLPDATLVELSKQLHPLGGAFILKGLPDNSFALLSEKLQRLRAKGAYVPILIDPKAYETFSVQFVPTFVIWDGEKFDKITGNLSLDHILYRFMEKGEVDPGAIQEYISQTGE